MEKNVDIVKIDRRSRREREEFLRLPLKLYGDTPLIRNAVLKTEGLLNAPHVVSLYLARSGGEAVGRMALYSHPGIRDCRGVPYGQAGLFEVVEDYGVFCAMLDHARKCFLGLNSLLFPFYISTWYHYRFITSADFSFFFEMPNKAYYPEFTRRYGVEETYRYISHRTPDTPDAVASLKRHHERLLKEGITFRPLDKGNLAGEVRLLHEMSLRCFKDNPFYTDIPLEEFAALYKKTWRMLDEKMFIIAMHQDRPVAFSYACPDYTPLFEQRDMHSLVGRLHLYLSRRKGQGMIYKSAAVTPEYRNKGLLSAMGHVQTLESRKRGMDYFITALTGTDNYPLLALKGTKKENRYELYSIRV